MRAEDVQAATARRIARARSRFTEYFPETRPARPLDPDLHRDLGHGWMLPLLLALDEALWQRWSYWLDCCGEKKLPPSPIPRIEFLSIPHPGARCMIENCLNTIPNHGVSSYGSSRHGSWRTWSGWQYVNFLLDWLLFALGHKGQSKLPDEPPGCSGAGNRLYQLFTLGAMLLWPHDYFGTLLGETSYGKGQGFYATPHTICEFMARMSFPDAHSDYRTQTLLDPCVGTGRILLHGSNHTLRLYGMDIDPTLCKATLVNGYLYAPWLVRPLPWLDAELAALEQAASCPEQSSEMTAMAADLSDQMSEAAPTPAQAYLQNSEHDAAGQQQVAPLLKRRRKPAVDPTQKSLF